VAGSTGLFPLQPTTDFGRFSAVRPLLTAFLLLGVLGPLAAQEQEGKLVGRLLRPNMELKSSEQNKKFVSNRLGATKSASVKTLYLQNKSNSKTFSNTRDFSAPQYNSWVFNASGNNGAKTSHNRTVRTAMYRTSMVQDSPPMAEADKKTNSSDYAGNRPYLEQGKSQKSLDRKNPPMTIDQVRELLNKNK
jgi:hypothetical protein